MVVVLLVLVMVMAVLPEVGMVVVEVLLDLAEELALEPVQVLAVGPGLAQEQVLVLVSVVGQELVQEQVGGPEEGQAMVVVPVLVQVVVWG